MKKKFTIVIVDDSALTRNFVVSFLKEFIPNNYEFIEYQSFEDLIVDYEDLCKQKEVKLWMFDHSVPHMNGNTFVDFLGRKENIIPVVILSAKSAASLVQLYNKHKFVKHIFTKPTKRETLKEKIMPLL